MNAATTANRPEIQSAQSIGERSASPKEAVAVLHVVNGEHYAGAERVQDLLALRLPDEGFLVGFACLKPDRFPRVRQAAAAPLESLAMRSRFDLRAAAALARMVRKGNYAILHAHTPRAAMVARMASIATGAPMVYHVHSPTVRDSTHKWQNRANALVERASLLGKVPLITVSHSLATHMRMQGYPSRRITVVPNGVPAIDAEYRPPRPTPAGTWTLGTVALFRPRKGIEVLLEAMANLANGGIAVRLRAVGGFETPEYERDVKELAARLGIEGSIEWVGFTQNVPAQLAKMDLLIVPSLFGEGLPMVVLEAMAAGLPVVGTQVEGVPEAIRSGHEGLLVPPSDAAALAEATRRIVSGEVDWQSLRKNAASRHAEHFSDRAMAAGVAEVYRRIRE